jgi:ubiquinol-cytochrome c reductase iron-sulfur subunit
MRSGKAIALAFVASFAGSAGLATVYALGGQPQLEGALLFVALGGLSIGLILWAKRLMPSEQHVEPRPALLGEATERLAAEESFEEGAERIGRRRFLGRLLGAAAAALGFAALFPIRSLGSRPGIALYRTAWTPGARAVTPEGDPIRASDLEDNSILTAFPEGNVHAADSQVVVIKMPDGTRAGRKDWSPNGIVAFSKICTHAGCPVGLFQAETAELLCPCHQSVFRVTQGCKPVKGPATRALPQLPLGIDAEGFVVARGDFTEPVGPAFWRMRKRP